MIAILAAVPLETELLRSRLFPCEVRNCGRRDLLHGVLAGQRIALLHSGIGKANAASAATALLETSPPRAVLMVGCGGAYPGSGLQVGDLAVASEEIYGDEGVLAPAGFLDMAAIGLPLLQRNELRLFNRFPADAGLLERARPLLETFAGEAGRELAQGPFVTVSTCSGTSAAGLALRQRTGGLCENMEGAAVAQVCTLYKVPFFEMRGISNHTEDRDLSRWDLKEGARIAQQALLAILGGWQPRSTSA